MSCSLDMLSEEEEEEGKKDVRGARCAAYESLLLEHCGLSSYTTQSFLLSPKTYGNSFHGVGLFLKCTLWQSMVLLLCPARLQNPKSVQSMAPAVLPKLPLVIP
jgi:hypothetical protein